MKKEQSDYYFEINGELFLYEDIFEKINNEHLELKKKFLREEIPKNKYKTEYSKRSEILGKASKYTPFKKDFIEEYLKYKASLKVAKEQWKHEREHYNKMLQRGLKPKIVILHLIDRKKIQKGQTPIILLPATVSNELDFIEEWSLEKFKENTLNTLDIMDLSPIDKQQKNVLRGT